MKRSAELRDLSDDHHTGLVLARRARRAAKGDRDLSVPRVWEEIAVRFPADLEPHFRVEERWLLPPLERVGLRELAARVREDHAALREAAEAGERSSDALARFGERLSDHIRFEERVVFDAAEERLAREELVAVARACREQRGGDGGA